MVDAVNGSVSKVTHLVVIGSSAGGIEALSTLVGTLSADLPAAVVIAQHLDPQRPSHLGEILSRRTTLPVRTVTGAETLQAGVIYVVPADRHIEVTDHAVALKPGTRGSKPSVDLLFGSATRIFAERLVAVVLTGTGSDGALGARMVHETGGTVIIQNPETAAFPGMPRSLAPTTVDIVADLVDIGPLVHAIVTGEYAPARTESNDTDLTALLNDVREVRGLDFSDYRSPTLLRRLQRRMVAIDADTIADYRRYIREDPAEQERLVSSILIKVTDFFRDAKTFAALRERILPALIESARERGEELRLWSAGCATGEEVYSLAILVVDLLHEAANPPNVRIFATDLDRDAVAFARRGVYPTKALENVPPELLARYFRSVDGEYEVNDAVRDLIVFGDHDAGQRPPFPRIDLVLCRNVVMYFTPALQQRVLHAFAFSLREGGYLVLGSAETPAHAGDLFTPVDSRQRIYQRTGQRAPLTNGRLGHATQHMPPNSRPQPNPPRPLGARRDAPSSNQPEELLHRLPVGIVIVNRRYDVQFINTAARQLLGIHGLAIGEDLVHLLESVSGTALRGAIDAAFRAEEPASIEELVTAALGMGEERHLHITCEPQAGNALRDGTASVTVTVLDITALVRKRQVLERSHEVQNQDIVRLRELMERLAETNSKLLASNDELAYAEATLRTTNEEYQAAQAEAQISREELETYGEELQATNEEMETLNEELKATIEELSLSNTDLDARAQELAFQRTVSEQDKAYLAAILSSMSDAVMVVDGTGLALRTNRAYDELIDSLGPAYIPRDEQGQTVSGADLPQHRAARGETFSTVFIVTATDGTDRWFEANGQPMSSKGAQGGVVVIREITERTLRRLQEQFMAMAGHELRTPLTALIGYSQLSLKNAKREDVSEPLLRLARVTATQAERMKRLVDDLTNVTVLTNGKLELRKAPVDLGAVASRAVETAQILARGQTIHLDAQVGALLVNGDAARLEDVLLNLLTNAIKYAPDTERIDVQLSRTEREAIISVEDAGPGMAPEELPRIFSRFYQVAQSDRSARSGLGLGLFIARETVTAHGGRIEVRAGEQAGSIFTISLPLLEGEPATDSDGLVPVP